MVDSAMFYLIGTLYPLLARATYPALGFAQYAGRGRDRGRRRRAEGEGADRTPRTRSPGRSTSTARSSSTGSTFIGGDTPSIADMRFAATLEFLRVIDYDFPAWAEEYMAAMEAALGDAYSEPAADVRGLHRLREVAGRLAGVEAVRRWRRPAAGEACAPPARSPCGATRPPGTGTRSARFGGGAGSRRRRTRSAPSSRRSRLR